VREGSLTPLNSNPLGSHRHGLWANRGRWRGDYRAPIHRHQSVFGVPAIVVVDHGESEASKAKVARQRRRLRMYG